MLTKIIHGSIAMGYGAEEGRGSRVAHHGKFVADTGSEGNLSCAQSILLLPHKENRSSINNR